MRNGRRRYDPASKERLVAVCLEPGVSVSRLALDHGINANLLRKWIKTAKDAVALPPPAPSAFIPVEVSAAEHSLPMQSMSFELAATRGEEPIVLLDYQPGRGQIHPQTFLGDYRGILMSDGYSAWRTLERATHIGCMAHSRRRFVDALKTRNKPGGPPEQALRFFEQLYRVERQARDEKPDRGETPDQCIRRFRQQHSMPVLNALKEWLDKIAPKVLPDSKLGDAVSYTLNQWEYLTRYVQDGRMPIDNNLLDRDIRIFATGRKTLAVQRTVDGAKASAVLYSLMLTCCPSTFPKPPRLEPIKPPDSDPRHMAHVNAHGNDRLRISDRRFVFDSMLDVVVPSSPFGAAGVVLCAG